MVMDIAEIVRKWSLDIDLVFGDAQCKRNELGSMFEEIDLNGELV